MGTAALDFYFKLSILRLSINSGWLWISRCAHINSSFEGFQVNVGQAEFWISHFIWESSNIWNIPEPFCPRLCTEALDQIICWLKSNLSAWLMCMVLLFAFCPKSNKTFVCVNKQKDSQQLPYQLLLLVHQFHLHNLKMNSTVLNEWNRSKVFWSALLCATGQETKTLINKWINEYIYEGGFAKSP